VVCPYCGDRFLFSYERSEEYQREHALVPQPDRPGRSAWLDWLVLTVTVAIVGLAALQWFAHPR
jgi:hypothetical protein